MSEFKYGDVLRLTDRFIATLRSVTPPDPYRIMFVSPESEHEFRGVIVRQRPEPPGVLLLQPGRMQQFPLNASCFELADD